MSVRYDRLVPTLKALLPHDALSLLGRAVAFIRRLREIEASILVWSVVLSRFGSGRPAFEQACQWYERLGGVRIWRRPFQMRFKTPRAVQLFEQAFQAAVAPWRNAQRPRSRHPLQRCFADVVVWDSTVMQVADSLKNVFKGTRSAKASWKACVAITVFGLLPVFAEIVSGNRHDMVRIPARLGRAFRRDLGARSDGTWARIPDHSGARSGALGHRFRTTRARVPEHSGKPG
jgi:hypothetical protein